jgi:hypoxanthine phosphoribosyltransferase
MHLPKENQPKRYLSWDEVINLIKQLGKKIPDNKLIYGIPRNGTILSGLLSFSNEKLKIGDNPFIFDKNCNNGYVILDDIHDTGLTLHEWEVYFETATIFWREKDGKRPTYFVETVKDEWIIFPWEHLDTSKDIEDALLRVMQSLNLDVNKTTPTQFFENLKNYIKE